MKHKLIDVKGKLDLETCVGTLKKDGDELSFVADWKNDLTLLIKVNFFWKSTTEKVASISVVDTAMVKSQEEENKI